MKQNDEPDVEAHRMKLQPEEKDEGTKDDDAPDVEAHRMK
jgi:hypothetical protein